MSKQDDFYRALSALRANYRHSQGTMSHCSVDGCNYPAVGAVCRDCCEFAIAHTIGNATIAGDIHRHTRLAAHAIAEVLDLIEGMEGIGNV